MQGDDFGQGVGIGLGIPLGCLLGCGGLLAVIAILFVGCLAGISTVDGTKPPVRQPVIQAPGLTAREKEYIAAIRAHDQAVRTGAMQIASILESGNYRWRPSVKTEAVKLADIVESGRSVWVPARFQEVGVKYGRGLESLLFVCETLPRALHSGDVALMRKCVSAMAASTSDRDAALSQMDTLEAIFTRLERR